MTEEIPLIHYSLPKNIVWIIHIVIGCFFITAAAVYLSYMDKDPKDVPFNQKIMNEGIYILILILGVLMFLYHGHLFALDKGLLKNN